MHISQGLLLLVLQPGPELKAIEHSNATNNEWGRQDQGIVSEWNARGPIATGGLGMRISKVVSEDVKMKTIRAHI